MTFNVHYVSILHCDKVLDFIFWSYFEKSGLDALLRE